MQIYLAQCGFSLLNLRSASSFEKQRERQRFLTVGLTDLSLQNHKGVVYSAKDEQELSWSVERSGRVLLVCLVEVKTDVSPIYSDTSLLITGAELQTNLSETSPLIQSTVVQNNMFVQLSKGLTEEECIFLLFCCLLIDYNGLQRSASLEIFTATGCHISALETNVSRRSLAKRLKKYKRKC